ncbi:hypothetical protein [Mesorhizobium sp. M0870]|uniref:hypothetical protein n=1 Tax=Mesorhizobium sp. M0870 TaxID=2957016 RepID=UPI003339082C
MVNSCFPDGSPTILGTKIFVVVCDRHGTIVVSLHPRWWRDLLAVPQQIDGSSDNLCSRIWS